MTHEPKPRSLQQLSDDLRRVRSQAVSQPVEHNSTRAGLKLVDKVVEPITDGPAEDEFLRRGPSRLRRSIVSLLFGWWTRRRLERQEHYRDTRVLINRLGSALAALQVERAQFKLVARQIAQAQQSAEVRLKTLQTNHDVLRDTLNAQAEAIEDLQKKVK
jgi:hypothetical protein